MSNDEGEVAVQHAPALASFQTPAANRLALSLSLVTGPLALQLPRTRRTCTAHDFGYLLPLLLESAQVHAK